MDEVAGSSVEKKVEKKVMCMDPDYRKAIAKYHKQVLESDGSGIRGFQATSKNIRSLQSMHREKNEVVAPRLEFVRVLKAMHQVCDIKRYYITFEAREDGGRTHTCQAVVRTGIRDSFSVLSFRFKPSECDQGSDKNGVWIWEGHLQNGKLF